MKESILITGGSGLLALNWALEARDQYSVVLGMHKRMISVHGVESRNISLDSIEAIIETLEAVRPKFVIHTAGLTNVEECESQAELARRVNIGLAKNMAKACAKIGLPLVHISTDHLFSGSAKLINENQPVDPLNVYAQVKAEAEREVLGAYPEALVVRTNFFGWGPKYRSSFSDMIVNGLRSGKELTLFKDVFYTPIHISTLVNAVHNLLKLNAGGVFNIVGDERISKYEFGLKIAKQFKLESSLIKPGLLDDHPFLVRRPHDMSLSNVKACNLLGWKLGGVDENIARLYEQEQHGFSQEMASLKELIIPYGRHHLDEDDIQAVVNILRSGELTQGSNVELFEQEIAKYVGAKYAVAVSSGTAGLHIAALAAEVGPEKSLITSPITFVASANAALYAGGKPVFADIDPDTINMSPDSLKETISASSEVRAIVPVHFAGLPCDMPAIKAAADDAGALVIEDAAHALGARYPDGSMVGCCANSHMTVFSFHPVKAIATGEGGMITTNDEQVYRSLLRLRGHGINKLDDPFQLPEQAGENGIRDPWYYEMQELGFNYRISDIQCGLGLSQLTKLDKFIARRRELVKRYDVAFNDIEYCRPAQNTGRGASGHHLYVLRVDFGKLGMSRAQLIQELRSRNIVSQVHYIPVPAHPYYRRLGFRPEDYPNAQSYYKEALSIPLFYDLTDDQQQYIISAFKELLS